MEIMGAALAFLGLILAYVWRANGRNMILLQEGQKEIARGIVSLQEGQKEIARGIVSLQEGQKEIARGIGEVAKIAQGILTEVRTRK